MALAYDELLTSMGRFGFSEREAKLYLLLLRLGRATARDLTRDSGMDRVLVYRTLDTMRARGLVQETAERPRKYVAIPSRVLFDRSLFERRRSLDEDLALARELSEKLPQMTQAVIDGAPRFQVITGAAAVYPFLREMLRRSEEEVAVMITPRALRQSSEYGVYEELPRVLRAGGKFRLIVEPDPRIQALLNRFQRTRKRFPNAEVRGVAPQHARLTLIDGIMIRKSSSESPLNRSTTLTLSVWASRSKLASVMFISPRSNAPTWARWNPLLSANTS